jgi:Zn-dependent protease with chaperone function
MLKTNAIFYDGISSISQYIELIIDEKSNLLVFGSSSIGLTKWLVEDVSFNFSSNIINIHYGSNPVQILKLQDKQFIEYLNDYLQENGQLGWYQKLINLGAKIHVIIALVILGIIVLSYLYLLPFVAEKAVVLIPETYDIEMGESFYNQYIDFNEVDSSKTIALNLFAKKLKLNNKKTLKFTVVKSETANAFALPDGNIVVFTGLLNLMKNYDELAGLIGHEVTHVNQRHSMKMMCRNVSGYLFVSAILSDVNGIMATIGDNINSLNSLSYSRSFEQQADEDGLNLMIQNNINPAGMISLFKQMQSENDIDIPQFLSSHPVTENRIDYIRNLIKEKNFKSIDNPLLKGYFMKLKFK